MTLLKSSDRIVARGPFRDCTLFLKKIELKSLVKETSSSVSILKLVDLRISAMKFIHAEN